jgi:hypothetical protein
MYLNQHFWELIVPRYRGGSARMCIHDKFSPHTFWYSTYFWGIPEIYTWYLFLRLPDLFSTFSWLFLMYRIIFLDTIFDIFLTFSWQIPDILTYSLRIPDRLLMYSWHTPDFFSHIPICPWPITDSLTYSWHSWRIPDVFLTYSWHNPSLFLTFYWRTPDIFSGSSLRAVLVHQQEISTVL